MIFKKDMNKFYVREVTGDERALNKKKEDCFCRDKRPRELEQDKRVPE